MDDFLIKKKKLSQDQNLVQIKNNENYPQNNFSKF
jgi:hypothetical protein